MKKIVVLLASGFEEIEAVSVIDVLRRAELEVAVCAVTPADDGQAVMGSHGIRIGIDLPLSAVDPTDYEAIVLPGGLPGATTLRDSEAVIDLIRRFHLANKLVAAICAAPIALQQAGVLDGISATSYPGFELPSANYLEQRVVRDGTVVTSRGPGTALEFSLALVERLRGAEVAEQLGRTMLVASPTESVG